MIHSLHLFGNQPKTSMRSHFKSIWKESIEMTVHLNHKEPHRKHQTRELYYIRSILSFISPNSTLSWKFNKHEHFSFLILKNIHKNIYI